MVGSAIASKGTPQQREALEGLIAGSLTAALAQAEPQSGYDLNQVQTRAQRSADGWVLKSQRGSHRQYVHPVKPGKVTLPNHTGDLDPRTVKSIWKQAGINERRTK